MSTSCIYGNGDGHIFSNISISRLIRYSEVNRFTMKVLNKVDRIGIEIEKVALYQVVFW